MATGARLRSPVRHGSALSSAASRFRTRASSCQRHVFRLLRASIATLSTAMLSFLTHFFARAHSPHRVHRPDPRNLNRGGPQRADRLRELSLLNGVSSVLNLLPS